MRKTYIVPSLEEVRLSAPILMSTPSIKIDNDNFDDDLNSDRSKIFGGFAWDDTEE